MKEPRNEQSRSLVCYFEELWTIENCIYVPIQMAILYDSWPALIDGWSKFASLTPETAQHSPHATKYPDGA